MKAVKLPKSGSSRKSPKTVKTARLKSSASVANAALPITIQARIDVGFGNALYLRGEGKGLSWNQGIPLTCVDGTTWKWSGEATDQVKFKLLLNDAVWASGEDLVALPGQKVDLSPTFC